MLPVAVGLYILGMLMTKHAQKSIHINACVIIMMGRTKHVVLHRNVCCAALAPFHLPVHDSDCIALHCSSGYLKSTLLFAYEGLAMMLLHVR